jgi:membrane-bound inhibitor of C-type lysozyme
MVIVCVFVSPQNLLVNRVIRNIDLTMKVVGKVGLGVVVLASMLSCSQANMETQQKWLSFRCPDGQTVMAQFHLPEDQFVNVRFAGRELRLPHVISGSGARYSDDKTTFWNRGKSVLIEVDDKIVVQDCMLQGGAR